MREDQVATALANPSAALEEVQRVLAERSLLEFAQLVWPVLEPGRKLVRGWAIEAICEHLEAMTRGEFRHLLINVPPGCMKSLTTDVLWPAWEWGPKRMPWARYVTLAYSQSLTVRDNRRTRLVVQSDIYQRLWGDVFQLSEDEANRIKLTTDKTGFKLASSIGGTVMGERGDRNILDDPNDTKDPESVALLEKAAQFFTEVLPTRINDPLTSCVVIIMQRTHQDDVSGIILARELGYEHLMLPMEFEPERRCYTPVGFGEPTKWARLPNGMTITEGQAAGIDEADVPAQLEQLETMARMGVKPKWRTGRNADRRTVPGEMLWPERFPAAHVNDELKPQLSAWGGDFAIAGQLQQRPSPRGGGMFKRADVHVVPPHEAPKGGVSVRGWDLAASTSTRAAYTAGMRMRRTPDGLVVIENCIRFRGGPGEVDRRMRLTAEADGLSVQQDVPQDPGQAGLAQKSHIAKNLEGISVRFSPESGDKETRASPLAAQSEAGNLYMIEGSWNEELLQEMENFPRGTYKDQVDAASRAYANLLRRRRNSYAAGGGAIAVPLA
jgi:predicted phage terminase large subunit-like protein